MFNKVILVGNLTRDVELRYLPNQSALAKLGLATNRRYKKQDGSQGEEVCFIDVNLFGRTAEVANQYLKKGSSVLIEGRLVLDTWMDNNGQKKSKHSITAESMQMLGGNSAKADANTSEVVVDNEPNAVYEGQPQVNQNNTDAGEGIPF
ncbi:single-stranded DNA-binding protein [Helicobacter apodemus]|uniref:Single-stranded DNA-binding protein n=1 Tax=Helicobacter apodemus TaxID=135569 RepID=A0A2U8FGP3_9HELI|nr:single-stranded DNA-binding protein [Helicobacter apodemus]AWI34183.1 single-stranded DNA-binding protein [Helicobacter apodemus]AWI34705.1 single-stranded DNA-binding protein [Helicobacter apodemus]